MTDACASPDLLSLELALEKILTALPTPAGFEKLPLNDALGRVTYTNVQAAVDVPSFRNSSMDGYAVHSSNSHNEKLSVIATSWAGKPYTGPVLQGQCVRIFTGAYVPADCDCVVMQETVSRTEDVISLKQWPGPEENIRNIGDDTRTGNLLLTKGQYLKPADIGLLASSSIAAIDVFKTVNVGFFSTGDELASSGSQLELGQIYDSNRYTLHALLTEAGANPIDLGIIPDNPDDVEVALLAASKNCDVILTSGGVSVGEADFITDVLAKIGQLNLWKIAIKPGKPLVFGTINDAAFFGLPGNPVSVMVTFKQVVLPALQKLMGYSTKQNALKLTAKTNHVINKQPGRMEFQRGFVESIDGELVVSSTGGQGSHMLSSMSKANCLIVLEQNTADVEKGQCVTIELLGVNL